MKITPLTDWLFVELEPEQKISEVLEITTRNPIQTAKVKAVGPGRVWGKKFLPTQVKPGERIAFFTANLEHKPGKTMLQHLEENHALIRETDILMVLEGDVKVSL